MPTTPPRTRHPALPFLAALGAMLGSAAHAECRVEAVTLALSPYVPTEGSQGALSVRVDCTQPAEPFALHLNATRDTLLDSGASLTMNLFQGENTLETLLSGNLNQLRGQTLRGSQTLLFHLSARPGQWISAGSYQAQLNLTLTTPLGQSGP